MAHFAKLFPLTFLLLGLPVLAQDRQDKIQLKTTGHAETQANEIVYRFAIRGDAEDAVTAEKTLSKRVKTIISNLEDIADIKTKLFVEIKPTKAIRVDGFVLKFNPNRMPPFTKDVGFTFFQHLEVTIKNLNTVRNSKLDAELAKVLERITDTGCSGIEDELDLVSIKLICDTEALKNAATTKAVTTAKARAATIASFSERQLGKVISLRETSCKLADSIAPGYKSWNINLTVKCDVDLELEFALQ